jgi:hypothetical protein
VNLPYSSYFLSLPGSRALEIPDGWHRITGQSIANLAVLYRGGRPLGMIDKPADTKTDKNAWRAYAGTGWNARFIGHRWTRKAAISLVESSI